MLEKIRYDLNSLLAASDLTGVFHYLRKILLDTSKLFAEANQLSGQYSANEKQNADRLLVYSEYTVQRNRIAGAVSELIQRINPEDLNGQSVFILEEFHAYTCDRKEQKDQFVKLYYQQTINRIRYYYIYGDANQEMQSLFRRFGYEMSGKSVNWRKASAQSRSKVEFLDIKPDDTGSLMALKVNLLKELLDCGYVSDLLDKKLADLLSRYKHLGQDDYLFILFTIDDYNWDQELIPEAIYWFVREFCGAPLKNKNKMPQVFFFFGIEYEKDNGTVQGEVEEIMRKPQYLELLPKLDIVPWIFIEKWFKDFDLLVPAGISHRDYALQKFKKEADFDMYNIELILKKEVDDFRMKQLKSSYSNNI